MLVLSRRASESIMVGDDIRIVILNLQGGQVRLGIEAPKKTPVHREEIYNRIREQKREGAAKNAIEG